ncbi:hypothetical protein [Streptomyces bluensis]|uniref:hypothetical protein n=1 Tax=Streptomyces bluensis TaxID=33897 RepID=UPI00332B7A29
MNAEDRPALLEALPNESAPEKIAQIARVLEESVKRPRAVGSPVSDDALLVAMVWVKAFIPASVPGYTKPVPGSPGITMVDDPLVTGCYVTDNRVFSPDSDAVARMTSLALVDLWNMELSEAHWCDYTIRVDCDSGKSGCRQQANVSRMHFVNFRGVSGQYALVDLVAAAANPCNALAQYFGELDYNGTFSINTQGSGVSFNGMVEPFPSFEIYAKGFTQTTPTDPPFIGVPLVQKSPNPGAGPHNIAGNANQSIGASAPL